MGHRARELSATMGKMHSDLAHSVKVMNYGFTKRTRKRKTDICKSLGSSFATYNKSLETGEEDLFGEEDMKNMKTELNGIKPKETKDVKSKNGSYSGRSQRGGRDQGNRNYHQHHHQQQQQNQNRNSHSTNYRNFNNSRGNSRNGNRRGR